MSIKCYKDVLLLTQSSKLILATDSNGKIVEGTSSADARFVTVSQATAQTITGGMPTFVNGVNVNSSGFYQFNSANIAWGVSANRNWFFGKSGKTGLSGTDNTGLGDSSLAAINAGNYNVGIGVYSLWNCVGGERNVAIGYSAAYEYLVSDIVAIGYNALKNATGTCNTGIGSGVFNDLVGGSYNTAVGYNAGDGITTGSNNTIIGAGVQALAAALSNNIILATGGNPGVQRLRFDGVNWNLLNPTITGTNGLLRVTSGLISVTTSYVAMIVASSPLTVSSGTAPVIEINTASFVLTSGTSQFLTGASTSAFLTGANTGAFLTGANTGAFLTGANTANFVVRADTQSFSFSLENPTATDLFPMIQAYTSMTIRQIYAEVNSSTSIQFNMEVRTNMNSGGVAVLNTGLLATTAGGVTTAISNGAILTNQYLMFSGGTLTAAPKSILVRGDYTLT